MTREESIDRLRKISEKTPIRTNGDDLLAITMAIKALSQEPICDRDCEHCTWTECPIEPCDDAVSRDAVIERLKKEDKILYTTTGLNFLIRAIEQLPSVTQKSETVTEFADRCRECGARYGKYRKEAKRWKNKWLKSQKSGMWDASCTCSVCGQWRILESEKNGGKYKFCPSCGARMAESEE